MDTLFAPVALAHRDLEPYRFWIWLQVVALRLYVRAVRGKGVIFSVLIDRHGNVELNWIEKPPEALTPDPLSFTPSKAYQAALTGPEPPHPGESRDLLQIAALPQHCSASAPHIITRRPLPPPDT
ncbi:hypothetical protein [Hyphomonas sp.]|uniref:hypothetical protein n=1 Tax=Hyphomonas sp. TaxID=87 RepID=UPI0025C33CFB|nr:hypothetical protein [Hyphomonas sp.]